MKSLLSIIILFLYSVHRTESVSFLRRHNIHIYSEVPRDIVPLLVHCHSGDDDFGNHTLHPGQSFSWSFKSNFFSRTLYSCRFWWGPRQSGFDVFYAKWKTTHNTYNYVVKGDGFYVNFDGDDHDSNLMLVNSWQ
ncbi:hypothetical protein ABFS83_14G035800 [Erythranthe nasuta]